MTPLDEASIDERHSAHRRWDLHAIAIRSPPPESEGRGADRSDSPRAHRCAHPVAEHGTESLESTVGERTEAHAVEHVETLEEVGQRLDDGIVLGIDVDPDLGPGREDLLELGDGFDAVDAGPADLRPRHPSDLPTAIGDPIEMIVVEGQHHTVGSDVRIGLDVSVAEVDRAGERRKGVLGGIAGAAPVGECDRPGVVEEGMGWAHGT